MRPEEIAVVTVGALMLIGFVWWLWRQDRNRRAIAVLLVLSAITSLFPPIEYRYGTYRELIFTLDKSGKLSIPVLVMQYVLCALLAGMVWVFSRAPEKSA